ncbi:MAG: hypothetical protein ACTJHK_02960 [Enterococcus viikkiensis]
MANYRSIRSILFRACQIYQQASRRSVGEVDDPGDPTGVLDSLSHQHGIFFTHEGNKTIEKERNE